MEQAREKGEQPFTDAATKKALQQDGAEETKDAADANDAPPASLNLEEAEVFWDGNGVGLLGTGTGFRPASDAGFKSASDQCHLPHTTQSTMSQSLFIVPCTVHHGYVICQICGAMSDLRSVLSNTQKVLTE